MVWGAVASVAASYIASRMQKSAKKGADQFVERGINTGFDRLGDAVFGGGSTSPQTAVEMGNYNRQVQEAQFPGTNPWERLGASSAPGGALEVQRKEAAVKKSVVQKQTGVQLEIAKMQGRAAGVASGAEFGAQAGMDHGDYITSGKRPRPNMNNESARRTTAFSSQRASFAKQLESWIAERRQIIDAKRFKFDVGRGARDPATASLMALASQAFEMGIDKVDLLETMNKHFNKLRALGVATTTLGSAAKAMNLFVGKLFGGGKLPGRRSSVPGVKR